MPELVNYRGQVTITVTLWHEKGDIPAAEHQRRQRGHSFTRTGRVFTAWNHEPDQVKAAVAAAAEEFARVFPMPNPELP